MLTAGLPAFTLQPNENHVFTVEYRPLEAGKHTHEAMLSVSQNHFENVRVTLAGECFREDVTLVGLPGGEADVVRLPDCALGSSQAVTFSVSNHSANVFKVSFPSLSLIHI